MSMKAEIISIGDELLIGQTINTNAAWLGEHLSLIGVEINQVTTIPDERDRIIEALDEASEKVDLVLITGGLGPTKDDITKHTLAEYFDTELKIDSKVLDHIKEIFKRFDKEMLDVNVQQAALPISAKIIPNLNGTASGMWFEKEEKVYISMPGVPYEMKGMMEKELFDRIKIHFETKEILKRTILLQGIGESYLEEKLEDWAGDLYVKGLELAYLPSPGIVRLRITAKNINGAKDIIEQKENELKLMLPNHVFGNERETLPEIVGGLLKEKKARLSTAESCTGGYIAHMITSISGSSDYFEGAVVSYANNVKQNQLEVTPDALEKYGAVSAQVVEQMANGVKKKLNTDYAIATSGIAGPTGGSEEKPVGMVWIAIATPKGIVSKKFLFGDNRERNIIKASLTGLNMLRIELLRS